MSTPQKSTIKTEAHFSEDGKHRYLLKKEWSKAKKKAMVIMKNPSDAGELILDHTTMFVINNLVSLDYGSVEILNLYSRINARTVAEMEEDEEAIEVNDSHISNSAARADTIVLAWGSGCSTSKKAAERQQTVLKLIEKHKDKLVVIEDQSGRSGFHPLSPQVRGRWKLKPHKLEVKGQAKQEQKEEKTKSKTQGKAQDKEQEKTQKEVKKDD